MSWAVNKVKVKIKFQSKMFQKLTKVQRTVVQLKILALKLKKMKLWVSWGRVVLGNHLFSKW